MAATPAGILRGMAYWLMKSEPDTYSIDDLERQGTNMWEGCRNYTVRNYLRDEMKAGDLAFFYHSSCAEPGVVGVMEIVGEPYPDPTQFDPSSEYYDPKSPKDNPRWTVRDVKFVRKFPVIPIPRLREMPELAGMATLRKGNRLSITPVTPEEWKAVFSLV